MHWDERIGRRLTLRDLNVLVAVVELGSMTKAAERLAVSQPVVSKAIADLEGTLGVRLLDRGRHGIEPTLYGAALVRRGLAAFDELRQGVREIQGLADPTRGEVRVGATPQLVEALLPHAIEALHRRYPLISVEVSALPAGPAMYRHLRERRVDLIATRTAIPAPDGDMAAEPLFHETLSVVAAPSHPAAGLTGVGLRDLVGEAWLTAPPDTAPGRLAADMFRRQGFEPPKPVVVTSSIALIRSLLLTGRYVAPFPLSALLLCSPQAPLRVLWRDEGAGQPVGLVTLGGRTMSPAARAFAECLQGVADRLGPDAASSGIASERSF